MSYCILFTIHCDKVQHGVRQWRREKAKCSSWIISRMCESSWIVYFSTGIFYEPRPNLWWHSVKREQIASNRQRCEMRWTGKRLLCCCCSFEVMNLNSGPHQPSGSTVAFFSFTLLARENPFLPLLLHLSPHTLFPQRESQKASNLLYSVALCTSQHRLKLLMWQIHESLYRLLACDSFL